jgi:hypothetical protein
MFCLHYLIEIAIDFPLSSHWSATPF